MARKTEKETREKLQKLSKVINENNKVENNKIKKVSNQKKHKSRFSTTEVIALVMISIIVSLILGGLFATKFLHTNGEKVEKELQDFINNYQYIIDNYNGEIDKEELFDAALDGMLEQLDANSIFIDSTQNQTFNINLEGSYQGLGIEVYNDKDGNIIINRVFEGSPADKKNLKPGDIIIGYNKENVAGMKTDKFVQKVSENKNKSMEITYLRDGKKYTVKLSLEKITLQSVNTKIYNNKDNKIGYLRISIFANNTYKQFQKQFEELKDNKINSLIIDLRDNSGGYLVAAEKILSEFLDSSHPIFQIQKQGKTTKYYSKGNKTQTMKIAILINSNSASASEVVASALKEQYNATLIGEKTYGKGTVQELQNLTDGNKYKLTTKNWLTSKGTWVDKKGIEPDVKVSLSKEYYNNMSEENDNQLQTAINQLTK